MNLNVFNIDMNWVDMFIRMGLYIGFAMLILILSVYIIDILSIKTKTSSEKVTEIRNQIQRMEHIDDLHTKIEDARIKIDTVSIYTQLNSYVNTLYDDLDVYLGNIGRWITQIVMDIVTPRLYTLIG